MAPRCPHSSAGWCGPAEPPSDSGQVEISDFLQRQGGVARTGQLERAGFGRAAIRYSVNHGMVTKVRRGVFALPVTHPLREAGPLTRHDGG
ncbi:type IV toxin-antitoxin system AbiEi family antitoxin domain-containing protein [Pseudarthrobacter sp. NPDC092439]|uniref:type IV toxin-antitoxin system AbiEi family antitoxin domain-containing protein n=1 Tax=unclassified Pseudarthrobacter TaxID=2647000 RepID=UPI00381FD1D1